MIDLKKLNEIKIEDLKNVDYKALWENLKKQPDRIILTVLIVITSIFMLGYISKRPKKIQQLNTEIRVLEEKIKAIKSYEERKKELDDFMNNMPETIAVDTMRKLLNDLAVKNNIYIDGFSPAQREERDLYETIRFQLNLSADEYRDIVSFVRDLESTPYGIRVDNWRGNMGQRAAAGQRRGQPEQLKFAVALNVTAVNLKNERAKN